MPICIVHNLPRLHKAAPHEVRLTALFENASYSVVLCGAFLHLQGNFAGQAAFVVFMDFGIWLSYFSVFFA